MFAGFITDSDAASNDVFIHRSGSQLVTGSDAHSIYLRGINLSYDRVSESFCGAGEWRVADYTDWGVPVSCWYQEKHFKILHEIGFNVLRVNLSYRIFEDNAHPGQWKQSGWDTIDQLIQWGRKYNLYLILDMHVAPGGAGIAACMGCGYRTWDDIAYQHRFQALWKAIASRYAHEPQIAAYDLLNEPIPTRNAQQWQDLAAKLVQTIRTVDKNHLLIVEIVNWVFDRNNRSPFELLDEKILSSFQFLIHDPQILYDVHDYAPKSYTLQYETGINGGTYPDHETTETTIRKIKMDRNMAFLDDYMEEMTHFWTKQRIPVNIGEWGTEGNTHKGGDQYTKDMLRIMDERHLHWQFYYIHRLYKIDCCFEDNPTTVKNAALVRIFKAYFHREGRF